MKTKTLLYSLALLTAIMFTATSWMWGYLLNVFYSFPFLLISVLLFLVAKKNDSNKKRYKAIVFVWGVGITSALISFFIFLL